jgi:hypothetical protein
VFNDRWRGCTGRPWDQGGVCHRHTTAADAPCA